MLAADLAPVLQPMADRLERLERFAVAGRVTRVVGLVVEATGIEAGLGTLCRITSHTRDRSVLAEVVGFNERHMLLMPLGELDGLHAGAAVQPLGRTFGVDVVADFSGGCADSGITAAAGCPTLCSVGPIGGAGHTPEEFILLDSVLPAAQTLALAVLETAEAF